MDLAFVRTSALSENLSNIDRKSIEHLSNIDRKSTEVEVRTRMAGAAPSIGLRRGHIGFLPFFRNFHKKCKKMWCLGVR